MVHRSYTTGSSNLYDPCSRIRERDLAIHEMFTKLRLDPIREEAFLIITTAFDNDFDEEFTVESFVTLSVRELLNIPEVVPLDMLRMSRCTRTTIQFH